jgi:AbiV family abortive infection protein
MPKKPKRTDLPDDLHLIQAITAAVASAQEKHLAASALVAAGGYWPSAYTLAALGFEELGKAYLCLSAITMRDFVDGEGQFVADFWDAFNGPGAHRAKNQAAHLMLRMLGNSMPLPVYEQVVKEMSEAAEATNDRKFRSLYVDFTVDGEVLQPTDVDEHESRTMADLLGSALKLIETHHVLPTAENVDQAELVTYFQQLRASLDREAMDEAVGDDPVKLIEFTEKIRGPVLAGADTPPEFLRTLFPNIPFDDGTEGGR